MVWFSNALVYRFTRDVELDDNTLEKQLSEFAFQPCGSQDFRKFGWTSPMGKFSEMFSHVSGDNILISALKEEKILPSSVVKESLNSMIESHEEELGRKLKKTEKDRLKDEVVMDLLPKAFSRKKATRILILRKEGLVVVDATSTKVAEDALALLRKTIGSLPIVPIVAYNNALTTMTDWVRTGNVGEGFVVGTEAKMASESEDGGTVILKNEDLKTDTTVAHLDSGKVIVEVSLDWQDRIDFKLDSNLAIKRLKFSDELKDQNEDIGNEDFAQRFDADFALMTGEFAAFLQSLKNAFGGFEAK